MRLLGLMIALALVGAAGAGTEDVLRRAPVPNALLRQGEVRLVVGEGRIVVGTYLHTRHLDRVLAKIVRSEAINWPDDPRAAAFVEALRAMAERAALAGSGPREMAIRFEDRAGVCCVVLARPGEERVLASDATYVRRNQELILADVFGSEGAAALADLQAARAARAAAMEARP